MLEIHGVRVLGTHGVLPEERERSQPFEFDLDVYFDMSASAESDNLEDTIDYSRILQAAADILQRPPQNLIERLAKLIGDAVLALDDRITEVEVTLRKTRPPVAHDVAWAGVRLTVSR